MRTLRVFTAGCAAAIILATLAVVALAAPSSVARSAAPAGATVGQYGAVAPDLTISLAASAATIAPGDGVLIRATVRNKPERGGADNVTATITMPEGLEVASTSTNRGPGKCTGTTTLRCFLDFMSPIHVGVINIDARAKSVGTAVVTGRVTSAQADANATDNTDTVSVTIRTAEPAGSGASTGGGGTTGRIVTGSSRADVITGTARNDQLSGGAGNDRISGGAGNDRISGGTGNDFLDGGLGRDAISGGAGHDTIAARDRARDTVDCGAGRDTVAADKIDVVARNCERVSRR